MSLIRRHNYCLFFSIVIGMSFSLSLSGQDDTVRLKANHYLFEHDKVIYAVKDTCILLPACTPYKIRKDISAYFVNCFKGRALEMFYRPESETTPVEDTVLHIKSENPYLKYQGKIIRKITVQTLDVTGAKKTSIEFKAKRLLDSAFDAVHIKTKPCVIRNNLLFDVGDTVNAYLLVDNEKNLRELSFIQDARIYIDTLNVTKDSVNIIVITKDLWTMGVVLTSNLGDWYRVSVFDANFLGYGQRLQIFTQDRPDRYPNWGEGFEYTKKNLSGTFIDLSTGYSNINGGTRVGPEEEESFFLRLSKPYLLPTSKFIWGLESSFNESINDKQKPVSDFRNYTCLYGDAWAAYSINTKKTEERRLRKGEGIYLGFRVQKKNFIKRPFQESEKFDVGLNNQWFTLGSITFFGEKFYKTRYVTGFGKTEDIPYGHKLTLIAGFQYQLFYPRYYAAVDAVKEIALPGGSFGFVRFSAGGFLFNGHTEDVLIVSRAYWYTNVFHTGLIKMRQKFFAAYAIVKNPAFMNWATINGGSGISGFGSSLVYGRQRLVAGTETTSWFPCPVLGFRIQSFFTFQVAQVGNSKDDNILNNLLYGGIGTGLRIKNENLIFKTLEVRAFYYPNAPPDIQPFVLDMSLYFELKFSQSPVVIPSFISFD